MAERVCPNHECPRFGEPPGGGYMLAGACSCCLTPLWPEVESSVLHLTKDVYPPRPPIVPSIEFFPFTESKVKPR